MQGAALVPTRTPAVRLACLDIKNLISGCLFDQSDAGATGVQPDKPPARLAFSFPHFFWRRKRNGVGCRAETRPPASNQAHRPNKKQQRPPSPPSPSGGRSECGPHPSPLPQAGEGVQGTALVPPRTPAVRLACLDIKNLISGCLFDQSDAGATGVQPDKPPARLAFSFPHFFWRRKRNGVGCRAETRPPASNQAHRPNKKQQRPHPRLPPAGEGVKYSPHPSPLPQAGEGVLGTALVPPRTPAVRLACLDIKNLISGCLFDQSDAGATGVQPDKPPARLAFSFPHFFWRRKRNGVGCRAETRPPASNQAHRPNKKQQRPPSPPSPSGGRSECGPLPQAGERAMQRIVSSLGKLLPCFNARAQYPESPPSSPWCTGAADHPARPAHRPLPPAGRAA